MDKIMYVIFQQRESGVPGSRFTERSWDRFYQGLESILEPSGLAAMKPRETEDDSFEYDTAFRGSEITPGAA